jgi:hypothetical protein
MHRIMLVRTPDGDEKVLVECRLEDNPAGAGKILEVKYLGDHAFEIHHFMMNDGEMVIYSSSEVTRGFRFVMGWSVKWDYLRCEVVHGQDLLEAVHEEIRKIARKK